MSGPPPSFGPGEAVVPLWPPCLVSDIAHLDGHPWASRLLHWRSGAQLTYSIAPTLSFLPSGMFHIWPLPPGQAPPAPQPGILAGGCRTPASAAHNPCGLTLSPRPLCESEWSGQPHSHAPSTARPLLLLHKWSFCLRCYNV